MFDPPAPGKLLLATPASEDENFHRTVVLLLAHGLEGTLGLVLNRPNDVPVGVLLAAWEPLASAPPSVFVGGPVSRSSMIGVARLRPGVKGCDGCQAVAGRLATVDLNLTATQVAHAVDALRLFSGYAGWDSGQLAAEIDAGGWYVLASDLDDAFTPSPGDLWERVLRRQGGRFALYANAPPRLSMN